METAQVINEKAVSSQYAPSPYFHGVAEVHPERAGPGAAVERDHERAPRLIVHVGAPVVGVVEGRDGGVVVAVHGLGAGGHLVGHLLALHRHAIGLGDGGIGGEHALELLPVHLLGLSRQRKTYDQK